MNNTVAVSEGQIDGNVAGGSSQNGSAVGNMVNFSGGTINGSVTGGYKRQAGEGSPDRQCSRYITLCRQRCFHWQYPERVWSFSPFNPEQFPVFHFHLARRLSARQRGYPDLGVKRRIRWHQHCQQHQFSSGRPIFFCWRRGYPHQFRHSVHQQRCHQYRTGYKRFHLTVQPGYQSRTDCTDRHSFRRHCQSAITCPSGRSCL